MVSTLCDQERSASAPTSCFEHVRGYLWRADPLSLRSRSESDIRLHMCSGEDCANAQISGRVVTRRVPTPRSMRHLCRVRAYTCANIRPASDADAARRRSDQRAIQRGRRPLCAAPSSKKSPTLDMVGTSPSRIRTSALFEPTACGRRPEPKSEENADLRIRDHRKIKYPTKYIFKRPFNR